MARAFSAKKGRYRSAPFALSDIALGSCYQNVCGSQHQTMTYQIIYSSESATPMQMDDLEEILVQARRNNARNGITGALVYVDGVFLQILEGESPTVQQLMAKISTDVRHETITVLKERVVPVAMFADWKMAYVSATAAQVAKWAGLSEVTAIPDVVTDMRQAPDTATRVAQSILSVLETLPVAEDKAD